MVAQLNPDSKISKVQGLTIVDTGTSYRAYDQLFHNKYYIYCGHKCDDNLKSTDEVLEIVNTLKAVNPIYLICGSYEGYLIADSFEALPDLSISLSVNTNYIKDREEKIHRFNINYPFYSGSIQFTEKVLTA